MIKKLLIVIISIQFAYLQALHYRIINYNSRTTPPRERVCTSGTDPETPQDAVQNLMQELFDYASNDWRVLCSRVEAWTETRSFSSYCNMKNDAGDTLLHVIVKTYSTKNERDGFSRNILEQLLAKILANGGIRNNIKNNELKTVAHLIADMAAEDAAKGWIKNVFIQYNFYSDEVFNKIQLIRVAKANERILAESARIARENARNAKENSKKNEVNSLQDRTNLSTSRADKISPTNSSVNQKSIGQGEENSIEKAILSDSNSSTLSVTPPKQTAPNAITVKKTENIGSSKNTQQDELSEDGEGTVNLSMSKQGSVVQPNTQVAMTDLKNGDSKEQNPQSNQNEIKTELTKNDEAANGNVSKQDSVVEPKSQVPGRDLKNGDSKEQNPQSNQSEIKTEPTKNEGAADVNRSKQDLKSLVPGRDLKNKELSVESKGFGMVRWGVLAVSLAGLAGAKKYYDVCQQKKKKQESNPEEARA